MHRHLHRHAGAGDSGLCHPPERLEGGGKTRRHDREQVIRPMMVSDRATPIAWMLAGALLAGCASGDTPADPPGASPVMRRLTQEQYRQSIADIFGADIKIAGRFEPDLRTDGLLALGTTEVSVTPAGFEQYNTMARTIAAQVVDEKHRDALVICKPAAIKAPDDACAGAVLARTGRSLFRRPLTKDELAKTVSMAAAAARTFGNFYSGLEFALAGLLVAPEFLFRVEVAKGGELDAFSKASRLSYLLWNTTPDEPLLAAAEKGELNSEKGLVRQVDRLMASPRLAAGTHAFFADMLGFDRFEELAKDAIIYPAYSLKVAIDAREQTLRTVTDHLIVRGGDYRDLFTTKRTFMTRALGTVYRVPVAAAAGWEPFEFPADDPRAGLLSQISFVAIHSHPGRSSPTLRGKAVRELLLCQEVPAPPGNVNFNVVQDTSNPKFRTARDRLTAHSSEPMCAGCHKITDPIGLGLENFDGLGQYRTAENGAPINAGGELNGFVFKDAASLGKALHDDPAATSCLASNVYKYAAGHKLRAADMPWVEALKRDFAAGGYRMPDLLRRVATNAASYKVSMPSAQTKVALLEGSKP
ncbi:MAG: DUF1588 domain-containing protein [Rhodospirillaceae bacterium]|nr:DUF1588 domain-containing protein [Rhodospirillaceae bacterium]